MKTIVYIHSTCRKTIQNAVRTKERAYNITGAIWNLLALLWNQKILLEGHVVGSNGKCTALYVIKNVKIKKLIEDVKHCQLIAPL